jgi:CBS domain-containing protein
MKVADIVKEATVINSDATFKEALTAMIKRHTNTLLVVDEGGMLSGEVSVVDLLDAVVPEYLDGDSVAENFATEEMFEKAVKDVADKPVSTFMSSDYNSIETTESLINIAATAIANQRARIPVVDKDGRPIGIISRQGLKHILAQFLGVK